MSCNLPHKRKLSISKVFFRAGIVPPVFPWYTHKEDACRTEM